MNDEPRFVLISDKYSSTVFLSIEHYPRRRSPDNSLKLFIGTFSKTLAPGLRLGWVLAEQGVVLQKIYRDISAAVICGVRYEEDSEICIMEKA